MKKPIERQIRDTYRDVSTRAKDTASNIKDQTVLSYSVKRKEIEDVWIPGSAKEKLTVEEIRGAERGGLAVGFVVVVVLVLTLLWYVLGGRLP
jgi:hypothetical protein